MKLLFAFLFCLSPFKSFSQSNNEISDSTNIPDVGWNKVLMMRNGNTLLFHLELRKQIAIKVFDKTRKEIASLSYGPKKMSVNNLDETIVRGIYDINGEAVLFFEQAVDNRMSLVRIRVDASTGKVIDEVVALQSESFTNKTTFHVIKQKNVDSYAVFCFRYNIIMHPESKHELAEFNEKHEVYNTIPIPVNNKDFKYTAFLGARFDNNGGICMGIYLSNVDVTSTRAPSAWDNSPTIFNKYLLACYKPKNINILLSKMVQMPNEVYPDYTLNSYNRFASNINVLMLDSRPGYFLNGVQTNYIIDRFPLFITINDADMQVHSKWLIYDSVNAIIKQSDTGKHFTGVPLKIFTNENGLTTVVYEEYAFFQTIENGFNYPHTKLGNIAISQLDDDGNELWAGVLPKSQVLDDFFNGRDIANRDEEKMLFRTANIYAENTSYTGGTSRIPGYNVTKRTAVNPSMRKQRYSDQLASINCYNNRNNFYFFYNDYAKNFNNTIAKPGDTVSKYELTDAFYYKMDRKRELKKNFLFGPSAENESRSVFLESADFDEKTNTYAALMFHRKGDAYTMHVAWCHLD